MSARPMTKPSTDAPSEIPLMPEAAKPMPIPVIAAVRVLGMRRVRISTTVAMTTPLASIANERLEILSNGLPKNRIDRLPDGRHGPEREQRDQCAQQRVLEEILTICLTAQLCVRNPLQCYSDSNRRLHECAPPEHNPSRPLRPTHLRKRGADAFRVGPWRRRPYDNYTAFWS